MKVLIVGSGGREHAISWKIAQSSALTELYVAPGNPGTAALAENVQIAVDDIQGLINFAQDKEIDLVIVGPELPLTKGLADGLLEKGIRVFGPNREGAMLEGSKSFAKEVMIAAGVPTAQYQAFTDVDSAAAYLDSIEAPIVLKANGLASGKGVFVCADMDEAKQALKSLFGSFSAQQVVVEQFLSGKEASYIVATDGERVVPLAASHDYKRIFDNDQGPNTGGMGTVSPTPHLSAEQEKWALANVIEPVIAELKKREIPFVGFLYAGLMISDAGDINVLEFNARLGDPETQSIVRRMQGDLLELLFVLSDPAKSGQLPEVSWSSNSAICLVNAAAGYPEKPLTGDPISGIEAAEELDGIVVFHAGTGVDSNGKLITTGGRVLAVTALGDSVGQARERVYQASDRIHFKDKQVRKDIAG